MPPKAAASEAARRKGPQFKPPRPVKASAQATAATERVNVPAPSRARKTATTSKPASRPEATIISSEDEQDDEDLLDDSDIEMDDAPVRNTRPAAAIAPIVPPIPAPLLARLLYENFEDSNTQIQKGAMNLVGKYMEIFVREAFARAKNERETAVKGGGISDGFLQVEDLEKLAPQLVLDF